MPNSSRTPVDFKPHHVRMVRCPRVRVQQDGQPAPVGVCVELARNVRSVVVPLLQQNGVERPPHGWQFMFVGRRRA